MTAEQFNEKYKDYLEKGHYGLAINDEELTDWIDNKFQEFIKRPGFSYSQIKLKFGSGRFYENGLDLVEMLEVEAKITELCNRK